jgi:hypothetical protein
MKLLLLFQTRNIRPISLKQEFCSTKQLVPDYIVLKSAYQKHNKSSLTVPRCIDKHNTGIRYTY